MPKPEPNTDDDLLRSMMQVILAGDAPRLQRMMAATQMTQEQLDQLLHNAAEAGNSGAMVELLRAGADPNAYTPNEPTNGTTPLDATTGCIRQNMTEAEQRGHTLCVKLLLEAGADPNKLSMAVPPLCRAVTSGAAEVVELLLRGGAYWDVAAGHGLGSVVTTLVRELLGEVEAPDGVPVSEEEYLLIKMNRLAATDVMRAHIMPHLTMDEFIDWAWMREYGSDHAVQLSPSRDSPGGASSAQAKRGSMSLSSNQRTSRETCPSTGASVSSCKEHTN